MLLAIVDQVKVSVFSDPILIARDDANTLDSPLPSATSRLRFGVCQHQSLFQTLFSAMLENLRDNECYIDGANVVEFSTPKRGCPKGKAVEDGENRPGRLVKATG
jgi:hypothetical protein